MGKSSYLDTCGSEPTRINNTLARLALASGFLKYYNLDSDQLNKSLFRMTAKRSVPEHIREQLDSLPTRTGVYLMKNRGGDILYVGKAVNLRSRVRSYWNLTGQRSPKVRRLTAQVETIETWVTDSELEALLLENTLIKQHQPRYNVRLKDDKRYPYIRVTWHQDYPKVMLTRNMVQDGSRYFGPYTSAWAVRDTLDLLRKRFPYLTCNRTITGNDDRACLYYHIGLCAAPCIGAVDREEYRAIINELMEFLDGNYEEVLDEMRREMQEAANELRFEEAASLRDQIQALERVVEQQKIVDVGGGDQDVLAFARDDGDTCVQVFFIRGGKLIGRESFLLDNAEGEDDDEVMESFVQQFYDQTAQVPPEILLPEDLDEARIIKQWLKSKRGADVVMRVPNEGKDKELINMATENAVEALTHLRAHWGSQEQRYTAAIEELQQALSLPKPPVRIECYDISHVQGTNVVGSLVVFEKGVPRKSDYRKFKLRSDRNDDFANMKEILYRRLDNWRKSKEKPGGDKWGILPDLIIIDGGRGQLRAAIETLQEFDLREVVPVISLAKRDEEVFMTGVQEPIVLEKSSPALHLVQRARDEAHRFAVSYQRRLRQKNSLKSVLEEIPGIGPKRRSRLLRHFGSVDKIRTASIDEITKVDSMSPKLAERVKEYLNG